MHGAVEDVPDQRVRPIVDLAGKSVEHVVQTHRLWRVVAIKAGWRALESAGLAPVDLAAARRCFADDREIAASGAMKCFDRPRTCRAGAHHDDPIVACHDHLAVLDLGGAGANPLARGKRQPAILAGAHVAETGARPIAEFGMPQMPAMKQHRSQQRIAVEARDALAVDADFDRRPAGLAQADKLSCTAACHRITTRK